MGRARVKELDRQVAGSGREIGCPSAWLIAAAGLPTPTERVRRCPGGGFTLWGNKVQ